MIDPEETGEELPAWSLPSAALSVVHVPCDWPEGVTREWAFGGSTGAGVRVCVVDSGVDAHPLVGDVQSAVAVIREEDGGLRVEPDDQGDLCGHGNACAGVIRAFAPDCNSFPTMGPSALRHARYNGVAPRSVVAFTLAPA